MDDSGTQGRTDHEHDLDDLATKYDRYDMAAVIDGFGGQIRFALDDDDFPEIRKADYDKVVVLGIGGSALPADILQDTLGDRLSVPLHIVRDYDVPARHAVGGDTLVIASSFSGNTEEILTSLAACGSKPAATVILSAGGRLQEIAEDRANPLPLVRIKKERENDGFQPRSATGYNVAYLARILEGAGVLTDGVSALRPLPDFLSSLVGLRAQALQYAAEIYDKEPRVYADQRHVMATARILSIKFNENAKVSSAFTALPEGNHNEMIGLSRGLADYALLYLRDPSSRSEIHERYAAMKEIFAEEDLQHVHCYDWDMPGDNGIERVFASIVFGDWLTYYCALMARRDPTPVGLVEKFKVRLTERRGR